MARGTSTANPTVEILRPIVLPWWDRRTVLVWVRGIYRLNHEDWTTVVVATILPPSREITAGISGFTD